MGSVGMLIAAFGCENLGSCDLISSQSQRRLRSWVLDNDYRRQ
jgi:hypothetical protein